MIENAIPEETLATIQGSAEEALNVLGGAFADADAPKLIEAVDDFIYRWQKGERPSEEIVEAEDAPIMFASLWGEQVVREFGWEWVHIMFDDELGTYAVVSPDRSLAIYPFNFVAECMADPTIDAAIALSFNMLTEGSIPQLPPNEYQDLLAGVQRIVPRA